MALKLKKIKVNMQKMNTCVPILRNNKVVFQVDPVLTGLKKC